MALDFLQRRATLAAKRLDQRIDDYYSSRLGTAASLAAINAAAGQPFYRISSSSSVDHDEARECFQRNDLVIDVQTHFVANHRTGLAGAKGAHHFIRQVASELFSGLDPETDLSFGEYLRCVFLESETSLAVLTSAPGTEDINILSNSEIAGARELVDRLAGTGRLLHHSIVHPNLPGELERMSGIVDRCHPNGFKVYTLYGNQQESGPLRNGWMLDDEEFGMPFLQRAQELGVNIICAHKGLSGLASTGSPRDIGPAAAAFPNLWFLVYHSGYEVPRYDGDHQILEGRFRDGSQQHGTDRLVKSLRDAGIGPGGNVYAELGSTQPLIDAFRAFHIPEEYQERYGYPALTESIKEKILGLNAARVYGIEQGATLHRARNDDLAWIKQAVAEFDQNTIPRP